MNVVTEHLSQTLVITLSVIIDSDAQKRQRLALAHGDAELLVAAIPLDNGDGPVPASRASSALIDTKRLETSPALDGY